MDKQKLKIFGKTKEGRKRTVHILGIKIDYIKKIRDDIDKKKIQKRINKFEKTGITKKKRTPKLILSLTSFPQRMHSIQFALYSLLNQTLKPDELILWLADTDFPKKEDNLPQSILSLKKNGLSIKWCKNSRPYKKLIPTLIKYPDDIIVTADDDIFYPSHFLELLYNQYLKKPEYIHCHRAHRIIFDENNNIEKYSKWIFHVRNVEPSFCNFLTGAGGVLYPPKTLYKDVLNEEVFMKLSPFNDDIWFWAMAVLNNTKINVVENNIRKLYNVNNAKALGLKTLSQYNVNEGGNDKQLKNIFDYYPNLKKLLNDTI